MTMPGGAGRSVSVRLLAQISGYISPLKQAIQTTKDLRGELDKASRAGNLDKLGSMAGRAGLALAGGFLIAATAAARFDKQMSEVAAITKATGGELDGLRQAAIEAGKDTVFSATESAKAEAELAKAGLTASQIMGGALRGALDLAAAGGLDLAEAADTAAKAMNIFGLRGKDVGHIADVLAAGANKSATDVHELSFALRMGGLAAKNSGASLEETVGTLAAFADNALIGSDAGTSFKTMLQMLAAPSDKAVDLMDELGISAYDAQGNFVGLANLAGQLKDKLGPLTQEQRNAALATIFGSDAMRAATVLYNEGEQGIRDYTAAVDDQGAASEVAAKKTDNLMGDVERLTGELESLFITSGEGASGGLRLLVQLAERMVATFGALPPPIQSTAVMLVGLGGAALLAFSAWVKLRRATAEALAELRQVGPIGARTATGLEHVTKWGGRAALAIGALQVAGAAFGTSLNPQIDAFAEGLVDWASNGVAAGEASRLLGENTEKLDLALRDATSSGKNFALTVEGITQVGNISDRSWTKNVERIGALDRALAQLVQQGRGNEAAMIMFQLRKRAEELHIPVDKLNAAFPEFAAAVEVAKHETKDQAGSAKVAADANLKLAGAFGEAASEADGLQAASDELTGKFRDATMAEVKAEEALDELTASFDEHGRSLRTTTEDGRANLSAINDLAEAAAEATQKKYDETQSVTEARKVYEHYRDELYKTLRAAGYTEGQAKRLADQWLKMPDTVSTAVKADTSDAMEDISDVRYALTHLKNRTVKVRVQVFYTDKGLHVTGGTILEREGGITEHAQTGLLREASIFAPATPARYAFAEPGTDGEAFVPKRGDWKRAMSILDRAAGWYGAAVVPRQGWYGGSVTPSTSTPGGGMNIEHLHMTVQAWNERFSLAQIERELAYHGAR